MVHVDVHAEEIVTIDIVDETTQTSETNIDEIVIGEIVEGSLHYQAKLSLLTISRNVSAKCVALRLKAN